MSAPRNEEWMKPLPSVGAKIKADYGPQNFNTWKTWGEIRAIVDEHLIVRRWFPSKGHVLSIITPIDWTYNEHWKVKA